MKVSDKLQVMLGGPGKWTQQRVAERIGVSQSTVNRWMRGTEPEGHHRDALSDLYAEVMGYNLNKGMMRIHGVVRQGTEVTILDQAEQDWSEIPPKSDNGVSAIRVECDSLSPEFRWGSVIYYAHRTTPDELIGETAIVGLEGGRIVIRAVHYTDQKGKWMLTSMSAGPMRYTSVEWVAPITWIKPSSDYIPF